MGERAARKHDVFLARPRPWRNQVWETDHGQALLLVFDLLDVTVEDLPAYTPHLKGTVEGLNRAVESMFLAALPGYARQPRLGKRSSRPKDEMLLGFEDFTSRLLAWTAWWNTEHRPASLGGKTPLEAWQDDLTPLRDVPAADLTGLAMPADAAGANPRTRSNPCTTPQDATLAPQPAAACRPSH
ncbi:hypothetical protein [Streptomyces sp. NPDC047453]|uniref:hypothetical protein n=1 Tax=Streptomyces sp. NPDC047453 TaxID=3154812 RepID=UPI0033DC411E